MANDHIAGGQDFHDGLSQGKSKGRTECSGDLAANVISLESCTRINHIFSVGLSLLLAISPIDIIVAYDIILTQV